MIWPVRLPSAGAYRSSLSWAAVFVAVALSSVQAKEQEPALPVCALIDTSRHPAVGALEARLFEQVEATWVERNEIDRVLREQTLDAAFGAGGVRERASFGRLLRADVLILVRARDAQGDTPALLECAVCDARRGLRLATAVLPAKDKELDAALLAVVERGLARQRQKVAHLVAVPPFLSDDLGYERNYMQSAYARLVEQCLLDRPGILVIELQEAQAVAREFALAAPGGEVQHRELPHYILGRYRHDGARGEETLRMSLRLVRGETQLNLKGVRELSPDKATEWVREKTAALWNVAQQGKTEPRSAEIEARQLAQRAALFQRIGNWEEAVALLEASLLVQPEQEETHRQAVIVYGNLARKYFKHGPCTLAEAALFCNYYERGLDHLEAFFATAGPLEKYQQAGQTDFISQFDHSLNGLTIHPKNPPEVVERLDAVIRHHSAAFLRIGKLRREKGFHTRGDQQFDIRALHRLSERERAQAMLGLVSELENLRDGQSRIEALVHRGYVSPPDTPATEQVIEQLIGMQSANARAAGVSLKRKLLAGRARPKDPATQPEPTVSDLKLEPVTFQASDAGSLPLQVHLGAMAGDGVDFFVADQRLYVMKNRGELRPIATFPDRNHFVRSLVYDGRYMWLAATRFRRSPLVLVIDPVSEKAWQFTSEHGLPFVAEGKEDAESSDFVRLAPVRPGQVCAAGRTGRSWLGLLSFDGKPSARLFHEARESPNPESEAQADSSSVMFTPGFMHSMYAGEEYASDCRILLGRITGNLHATSRPLLIDPQRQTVEVAPYSIWGESRLETLASHRGSVYLQQNVPSALPQLMEIAHPGDKKVPVVKEVPETWVIPAGDRLHLVGRQWLTADPAKGSLETIARQTPWYFQTHYGSSPPQRLFHKDDHSLASAMPSHHYGTLVFIRTPSKGVQCFRLAP